MKLHLKPGSYIVAVSGGVDSMVLLSLLHTAQLRSNAALHITVAHLDHGMRSDSALDKKLVRQTAQKYGMPFVFTELRLGGNASEETARNARYEFLFKTLIEQNADAIITAHHQDDVFETAVINILRGTNRKGLTALQNRKDIVRPLLNVSKQDIIAYARENNVIWREDSTNQDTVYLRNYIRKNILPRLDGSSKRALSTIIEKMRIINGELDELLDKQLQNQSSDDMIDRQWFNQLPHSVAKEVIANWLRQHGERNFDSRSLDRMVVVGKVALPGKAFPLSKDHRLRVNKENLALAIVER